MTYIETGVPRPADPPSAPADTAPLRLVPRPAPTPEPVPLARPQRSGPQLRPPVAASGGWMRVGPVALTSARRYLMTWAAVLFGVLVVLQLSAYALLSLLGVTSSVSRALAVVSGQQLPGSGVVPMLQLHNVVPMTIAVALVLSALWLLAAAAVVMMHNAVAELTGGFPVRIRPDARGPQSRTEESRRSSLRTMASQSPGNGPDRK